MWWVGVFAGGAMRAGAAELAVEGDICAGECSEGQFTGRQVGAEASV